MVIKAACLGYQWAFKEKGFLLAVNTANKPQASFVIGSPKINVDIPYFSLI